MGRTIVSSNDAVLSVKTTDSISALDFSRLLYVIFLNYYDLVHCQSQLPIPMSFPFSCRSHCEMSRDQIFQVLISFAVEPRNEVTGLLDSAVKRIVEKLALLGTVSMLTVNSVTPANCFFFYKHCDISAAEYQVKCLN